jgi:hypothetical protein
MSSQKEPLSSKAKSTNPHVLAKYMEDRPKIANLLRRMPAHEHVIDVYETSDIIEYNALGPVLYRYELYVYYANKDGPMYTYHTYDMSMKHPNPEQEEYSAESKQRRVSIRSPIYNRLKPLCDIKETRLKISNPFAALLSGDDSDDSEDEDK